MNKFISKIQIKQHADWKYAELYLYGKQAYKHPHTHYPALPHAVLDHGKH